MGYQNLVVVVVLEKVVEKAPRTSAGPSYSNNDERDESTGYSIYSRIKSFVFAR